MVQRFDAEWINTIGIIGTIVAGKLATGKNRFTSPSSTAMMCAGASGRLATLLAITSLQKLIIGLLTLK